MGFYPELDNITLDELIERFRAAQPDPVYAAGWFTEIGFQIGKHGEQGIAFLLEERPHVESDEDRLRGVLLGLSCERIHYSHVRPIFYAYLSDPRDMIVLDAIEGLGFSRDKRALSAVVALRAHPSGFVRGAVLRYFQHCYPKDAVPAALAALDDPAPVVRSSAIDVLDELLVAVLYLDRIRPFLKDPDKNVRGAAAWAINAAANWAGETDSLGVDDGDAEADE
jgi:hypothetical protein